MSEGFAGDPFHEGGSQPLAGLKGGMSGVHTQMPKTSESASNQNQDPAPAPGWNTTSLGSAPRGTGNNDKAKAH